MKNLLVKSKFFLTKYKNIVYCIFGFLLCMTFYYPIGNIGIENFHNDDKRLIDTLSHIHTLRDIFEFIFSIEFFKFRPLANLQYLIEYWVSYNNYKFYITYNIFLLSIVLFYVLKLLKKQNNYVLLSAAIISICLSKFALYGVWNILGSFELLSALLFLIVIYYIENYNKKKLIIYALSLILVSEKYLPFIILIPIILNFRNGQPLLNSKSIKLVSLIILMYFFIRFILGIPLLIGTQTDNVVTSFDLLRTIKFYLFSILELIGLSMGPRHLTGMDFPDWVPMAALYSNGLFIKSFFLGVLVLISVIYFIIAKSFSLTNYDKKLALIFFVMVLPACITLRVELRWLFPAFLMLTLLIYSNSYPIQFAKNENIVYLNLLTFLTYSYSFFIILYSFNYQFNLRNSVYFAGSLSKITALGN